MLSSLRRGFGATIPKVMSSEANKSNQRTIKEFFPVVSGEKTPSDAAPVNDAPKKAKKEKAGKKGGGGGKRLPKIAKGARDFGPASMVVREKTFKIVTDVFKRHGAESIDTPVFELKETLTGKYGEDSKLIYDLADQGGELLALRYDLTVPFARYLAINNVGNIKRYHIARVYRRDEPSLTRGRYREFYQCDFDIAGQYSSMMPDAEVCKVVTEILDAVPIGPYQIKISHRKLLDAMMSICGVPDEKFRTICSSIDKLDKEPWEAVKKEMCELKGLDEAVADKIEQWVVKKGRPFEVLEDVKGTELAAHPAAKVALEELALLFEYLDGMQCLDKFDFDLSLARGLDYYTGLIYEAVLLDASIGVGSIAAGGRYDDLVGMFKGGGKQVPCVGVSIGIERILAIMERLHGGSTRTSHSQVLVASAGGSMVKERFRVCAELWKAGVCAETVHTAKPKMQKQLERALDAQIPYMIVVGEDEVEKGVVKVKTLSTKEEVTLSRSEYVDVLKKWIAAEPMKEEE
eukprot:Rmarinus@m.22933